MLSAMNSWIGHLSLSRKLTGLGILTSAASLALAAVVLVAYDRSRSREEGTAPDTAITSPLRRPRESRGR